MHKSVIRWIGGCVLGLCAAQVSALTVVECIDVDGSSSFRDKCPPGMTKKGEKRLYGVASTDEQSLDEIAAANPITMFTVPDCDACDLVRSRLSARNLPFTEKNVQDNAEIQEEMKAATGALTVPAVVIGRKVLTGYSSDALDGALEDAGYPPASP